MKLLTSTQSRHILFRMVGDELHEGLRGVMRQGTVACGWMRASGVLIDVDLRAYSAEIGGLGAGRRIGGPVQLLSLEGSVGLADGDVSIGLRAVLARETDRGIETLAGEISTARVVALEGVVAVFDDLAMARTLDPDAGVWLLGEGSIVQVREGLRAVPTPSAVPAPSAPPRAPSAPPRPPPIPSPTPPVGGPAWSEAIAASPPRPAPPAPPRYNQVAAPAGGAVMPQRPARIQPANTDDGPLPEVGDVVEHFAFGMCDVIKSDGDRLHLRVHRDGRIKEIALEMLRVTLLTTDGEIGRYKLDRRL